MDSMELYRREEGWDIDTIKLSWAAANHGSSESARVKIGHEAKKEWGKEEA